MQQYGTAGSDLRCPFFGNGFAEKGLKITTICDIVLHRRRRGFDG